MGKYIFNEVFKEIVDTYYIDCNVLGDMIDRHPSRIRHYKIDSKPSKLILDKLIKSINEIITEKNDSYINHTIMAKINQAVKNSKLISEDLYNQLQQIDDINSYISFLLKRSLEFSISPINTNEYIFKQTSSDDALSIDTMTNQAHQYFENNLYPDAKSIYEELLLNSKLLDLPKQSLIIYTDLGLIYRSSGLNALNINDFKKSIEYFTTAAKISLDTDDSLNYGIINKYIGTVYTNLSSYENAEDNLKMASKFYNLSLSVLWNIHSLDEHARVLINYGTLYLNYADIRNTRSFLKNSISYYKKALEYYDQEPLSFFKAFTYLNCSSAYFSLSEICNTKTNAEQALDMVNQALKFYTIEDHPVQYAQCISTLGAIYFSLANYFDTIINCEKAAAYITQTLNIVTEDYDTNSYLIAQLNLSAVYILLSQSVNKHENLAKAIDCIDNCQKYYKIKCNSIENLKVSNNHAHVLSYLGEANSDITLLNKAENLFLNILDMSKKMNYYFYKFLTFHNLSSLYYAYYGITKELLYLDKALKFSHNALELFTVSEYPLLYALTKHLLGKIHGAMQDYELCRQEYENCLQIFTKDKYPERYKIIIDEYNQLFL